MIAAAIFSMAQAAARGGEYRNPFELERDAVGDAVPRPTDPGASAPFDPYEHHLPDLVEMRIGAWAPDEPAEDLFAGRFEDDESKAQFFRVDLVVRGLVNPPGDVRPWAFDPFAFGPHPLYGFVEFDMDRNVDTGGELVAPQYRYLGNIVRFGGNVTEERLQGRAALDAGAFDDDIDTPPFVDRSGEEFHLALLGGEFRLSDILILSGDLDQTFESGETWQVAATFFHRAHGYEEFSFVNGGQSPGQYMPVVTVQFAHDPGGDQTVVSLVFPLTQIGAALQRNEPVEPLDFDPGNQASLHEALYDLEFSADFLRTFPSGDPNEAIIRGWAEQDPTEFLESEKWETTVLLGTSYSIPVSDGVYYVWSDAYPNVDRGDVNGDDEANQTDVPRITEFIEANDFADGVWDGVVAIVDFAVNFSVFDVNHDGRVDDLDLLFDQADGDVDDDDDVDLWDFAWMQRCFGLYTLAMPECAGADLDLSGEIEWNDLPWFQARFEGPNHP